MIFLLFLISFLLIMVLAWTSSIYYIFLHRKVNEGKSDSDLSGPDEDPLFSIIIPCFREKGYILNKLENTAALDYPSDQFNVIVIDGGSNDGTGEIAQTFCESQTNFSFSISSQRGKIPQVNQALSTITDGIVMITDVDGRLESDALLRLKLIYQDPEIGCAGAYVVPADPLPEDGLFWQHQNAMRIMESRHGHSSVMVAVAYTFRRDLFKKFPDDVIADDVYTAFISNTKGMKSLYSPMVRATELRSGSDRSSMFSHKLRKLNANMRELKRFLPDWRRMKPVWQVMFLTKFMQSWVVAPIILILVFCFILSLVITGWPSLIFWGGAAIGLLAIQSAGESVLKKYHQGNDSLQPAPYHRLLYSLLFLLILIGGFFRYFFVRQTSSYNKVN